MSHASRLTALEQAKRSENGFKVYRTNDALQARGLYSVAGDGLEVCTGSDVGELDDAVRALLVGQDVVDADERAGYRCIVVCYTYLANLTPA